MDSSGGQERDPQKLRVLLVEPRLRYRRCLAASWNRAMRHDEKPSDVVAVGDPRALTRVTRFLEDTTYEAVVFPVLPGHPSADRAWHELDAAGYTIGYLFHAPTIRGHVPKRLAGRVGLNIARAGEVHRPHTAYMCKARFGCHHRILRILSGIDPNVLEVRPPDETPHERYRKILNRVSEGFWDVGPDLQLSYANAAFKNLVGDPNAVGRSLAEFFEEADRPRIRSILSEHREGIIIPFAMRLKGVKTGDRARVISIDPSPRFGWAGTYLGSSGLVRDITDRPEATEASLRQQRELYTLYAVAATLSRVFGLRELVAVATEKIREQLGVDATCAWVRRPPRQDGKAGELIAIEPEGLRGIDAEQLGTILEWCRQTPQNKPANVVRDTAKSRSAHARRIGEMGFRCMATIPLVADQHCIGYLWLACQDPTIMNRAWVSLIISIGHLLGLAIVNAMGAETRIREEARRKLFYREAVWALTGGKLTLLERTEMQEMLHVGTLLRELRISRPEDVQAARRMAEEVLRGLDFGEERAFDVATCVSEAATNTLLHGKGGTMRVTVAAEACGAGVAGPGAGGAGSGAGSGSGAGVAGAGVAGAGVAGAGVAGAGAGAGGAAGGARAGIPDGSGAWVDAEPGPDLGMGSTTIAPLASGTVRFSLEDHGPGIRFSELPRAILKRGYSTTVSMGLGYTLILEMMDGIHLCTDPRGTTLVMDAGPRTVNAELDTWLEKLSE